MALPFYNWSRTASSNANADPTVNWQEGQAPSSVNDSGRAMMASTAAFRDDIAGAIVTGGASTAFTVTSYQIFDTLAHMSGQMIAFTPNATSTNAVGVDVTLNVDGLGAKPIRMQPSVALPGGTLILGTPYLAVYNNSDGVFYLHNTINPYAIPISAGFDYWGPTTPNSSFAFPLGQAISRTTYSSLFSGNPWSIGTTYGVGDGSTTFNLPDKGGRVSAMKEASATRLTTGGSGINGSTLGAANGLTETNTLTVAQLAAHHHTGTTGNESATHTHANTYEYFPIQSGGGSAHSAAVQPGTGSGFLTGPTLGNESATHTHDITTADAGSGAAHNNVQPTIVCNYILRII